jgi:hypothetical protein
MNYSKSFNTKRFTFGVDRNTTSKQAGSNIVTIATRPEEGSYYSTSTTQLSMTVKEARALQGFLNSTLMDDSAASVS